MAEIVAADDEPAMRALVQRVLRTAGHNVRVCDNGQDLVRQVHAQHPDVVVTDNDMPIMSGLEAVEELRADPETCDIPVVLATGSVPPNAAAEVLGDADRVLIKPFTPRELRSAVDVAVNHDHPR
jgi:CheY-like chemotaxis protein